MRPLDVVMGAALAGIVAFVAWRAGTLTRSGAIAAFVVGTLTYGAGTAGFTLILLAFFGSSVALSRVGRARKRALVDVGKHGARDALQVLANGGVATACAVGFAFAHDLRWALAFAGAYAAATADTWATEIGTLARQTPRSIVTFRPFSTGMSGGITPAGTAAEIGGALWIGLVAPIGLLLAYVLAGSDVGISFRGPAVFGVGIRELAIIPIAGIAGATVDSLLGATLQELRRCDVCERTCETDPHACGNRTRLVRGIPGMSNDVVNLLATAVGAGVAVALPSVLR
ncbi:MAG TPA: DUF92 domain-containing protein [Dongiaceae bacterium]|nr:DUF92 domain-containing protein [Dongiaceae bacterium]